MNASELRLLLDRFESCRHWLGVLRNCLAEARSIPVPGAGARVELSPEAARAALQIDIQMAEDELAHLAILLRLD